MRALVDSGDDLLSRAVSSQVPSALKGLTSVFGMGTGDPLRLCHRKWLATVGPADGFALPHPVLAFPLDRRDPVLLTASLPTGGASPFRLPPPTALLRASRLLLLGLDFSPARPRRPRWPHIDKRTTSDEMGSDFHPLPGFLAFYWSLLNQALGLLVPTSSMCYHTSTDGLSTRSSPGGLTSF